jgi:ankyrin repeat protein
LVWLSLAGAVDTVRRLIERGAHPSTSAAAWGTSVFLGPRLMSVFAAALYTGNDDLASFLLQRGADVNIPAGIEGHMSPLAASISRGRLDWAKELIRRGADPRDPIALWAAAHTDSVDAYNLICSACTKPHGRSIAEFARFAASEAINRGNLAFLRTIIDNGVHLNAPALPWRDVRYWDWGIPSPNDPLLCAVGNANIDAIQLLLDNGADPNRAHLDDHLKDGPMPILTYLPGCSSSSVLCSITGILINAGARINYSEPTLHSTPLASAVRMLGSVAVLDLLILNGGLVDAVSSTPHCITTPLCEAVHTGSHKFVRKLLAESARVFGSPRLDEIPTPRTAIQMAAQKGHLDMLKLLLEAGENGSQFISEYPFTLRLAYRSGHTAIAHYLQSYRIRTFGHLSCDTDKEILMDIEDKRRDTKYWFKFWEDERYSGWKLLRAVRRDPEAFAFISKLGDNTLTGSDDSSLNGCDNSLDTSDNASKGNDGNSNVDTNLLGVSNEESTILCTENVDGKTKSVNDLTDLEWQEFLNFDVDQSYPMPDRGSCAIDASIEVLAEQTPTEPTCQPVGSNVLPQFMSSDGFDASQNVAESSDWMSVLNGDTPFMLWEQNGDGNALTDLDLDLWPYSL